MKSYKLSELKSAEIDGLKARPRIDFTSIFNVVQPIGDDVQNRGDAAVVEYTSKFDKVVLSKVVEAASDLPEPENEKHKYQKDYMDSIKQLEEKWMVSQQVNNHGKSIADNDGHSFEKTCNREATIASTSSESNLDDQKEHGSLCDNDNEITHLRSQILHLKGLQASANSEIIKLRKMLENEANQKEKLEEEIAELRSHLLEMSLEADETRRSLDGGGSGKKFTGLDSFVSQARQLHLRDSGSGTKASTAKLFEQVGLQKILSLLQSDEIDVRVHAVKVVANLATEEDETIRRLEAGAIANLAMNETNQELIMAQDGITLLSMTAADAEDPQTLRMVAGAIANLCGNDKLQARLRIDGGIKELLGMVRCRHPDVLAQVAQGIANFAKCESRASTQGEMIKKAFGKLKLEHVVIAKGNFEQDSVKPNTNTLEESEILALLRDEENEEDKLTQTDINEEDLLNVLDRTDLVDSLDEKPSYSLPLKGPGWEVVLPAAGGSRVLSSLGN